MLFRTMLPLFSLRILPQLISVGDLKGACVGMGEICEIAFREIAEMRNRGTQISAISAELRIFGFCMFAAFFASSRGFFACSRDFLHARVAHGARL